MNTNIGHLMTVKLSINKAPSSYNIIKDIPVSFRKGDIIILYNKSNCMRIVHNCLQLLVSQIEDRSKKKGGDLVTKTVCLMYKHTDAVSLDLSDNRIWEDQFVRNGIHECSCSVGKAMRKIWKEGLDELRYNPYSD
jgi:hypothetical protein